MFPSAWIFVRRIWANYLVRVQDMITLGALPLLRLGRKPRGIGNEQSSQHGDSTDERGQTFSGTAPCKHSLQRFPQRTPTPDRCPVRPRIRSQIVRRGHAIEIKRAEGVSEQSGTSSSDGHPFPSEGIAETSCITDQANAVIDYCCCTLRQRSAGHHLAQYCQTAAFSQGGRGGQRQAQQHITSDRTQQHRRLRCDQQVQIDLAIAQWAQANLTKRAKVHLHSIAVGDPPGPCDQRKAAEAGRTIQTAAVTHGAAAPVGTDHQRGIDAVSPRGTRNAHRPALPVSFQPCKAMPATQFSDLSGTLLQHPVESFATDSQPMRTERPQVEDRSEGRAPSTMWTDDGDFTQRDGTAGVHCRRQACTIDDRKATGRQIFSAWTMLRRLLRINQQKS